MRLKRKQTRKQHRIYFLLNINHSNLDYIYDTFSKDFDLTLEFKYFDYLNPLHFATAKSLLVDRIQS
jgi:hypothetical protein